MINETPYSAYTSLRKGFVKKFVPKCKSSLLIHSEFQVKNEALKKQLREVSANLKESEARFALAHTNIEIQETKVKKTE